jgi:hypothetical protein
MNNKFNSENNEKVINIAESNAPINASTSVGVNVEKLQYETLKINNDRIGDNIFNSNIYHNQLNKDENQPSVIVSLVALVIIAIIGVVFVYAFTKLTAKETPNKIEAVNTNIQPSITPTNTNVNARTSNQSAEKEKVETPQNKRQGSTPVTTTKVSQTPKLASIKDPKPKSTEPPNCAFTSAGC